MNWLNQIERRMGRHYIPQLMKYLCLGMLGVFILDYLPLARSASQLLYFNRALILKGQVWRLITFIFLPPSGEVFWILLNLYFYYFLGVSLENHWGSARFNIYYALGVLGSILGGFLTGYATNSYLNLSLLLAFAALFPDEQFMLFFVIPVKVKWFGLFAAAVLIYSFLMSGWAARAAMVVSLLPFFLFFGKQAWLQIRMDFRRLMNRIRR